MENVSVTERVLPVRYQCYHDSRGAEISDLQSGARAANR
jgi:hypothetical protein